MEVFSFFLSVVLYNVRKARRLKLVHLGKEMKLLTIQPINDLYAMEIDTAKQVFLKNKKTKKETCLPPGFNKTSLKSENQGVIFKFAQITCMHI